MERKLNRRKFILYGSAAFGTSLLAKGCAKTSSSSNDRKPIIVGGLHDETGAIALYGVQMVSAAKMAIAEINAAGGLLGRQVEFKQYDTQSDIQKYTQLAQQLILGDKVDVLVGGITSASREAIRPIVDKYKKLYFYNTQYEGGVCDKYVFCTGVTPSSQSKLLIDYAAKKLKAKRIYTIAADYNFGRITADWGKLYANKNNMQVVSEEFIPLDVSDFSTTIGKIQQAKPDVIYSVLVGSNHEGFFGQWAAAGLQNKIPYLSPTFVQPYDQDGSKRPEKAGYISAHSYYINEPREANKNFVSKFHQQYGDRKYINFFGADTYTGVMLWAEAVKKAGTTENEAVIKALEDGVIYDRGPLGSKSFDKTHHVNHTIYILKSNAEQGFELVDGPYNNLRAVDDQGQCDLKAKANTFKQFVHKF